MSDVWGRVAGRVPTGLLIGGEWVGGSAGALEVEDPSSAEPFVEIAAGDESDMVAAVAAAHDAGPAWAATSPRERAEVLRRAHEAMIAETEEIATVMVLENGKAFSDAVGEVRYAAEFLRWFSELAAHVHGQLGRAPAGDKRILTNRRPVGVALLVTPWNFPAAMATRKIGPALAAGCTVVLKPAKLTPLTANYIGRLLVEAGVPDGVVNIVTTASAGAPVAAALADDRVRKLSFTGSTEVGRILLEQAAGRVVNCSMELGGNAPLIVFDDADIDLAVQGAMVAKMRNAGEACTAANRIYVHESVAGEFTGNLTAAMAAQKVGPGLAEGVEVGPLVDQATRDKVEGLVAAAVDAGGKVRTGGRRVGERGWFYAPTVISGVEVGSPILGEEIFGPVAPIVTFTSDDEAVAGANDTPFGLAAYVFTGDLARGLNVAERIEAGMVGVNRGLMSDPAAPFGGLKQSGLAREGGTEGLDAYLETQYVAADW
jgi:succinate-semialdehyde dehydrogenase/glutarate-semialdehyde dehydrogenase